LPTLDRCKLRVDGGRLTRTCCANCDEHKEEIQQLECYSHVAAKFRLSTHTQARKKSKSNCRLRNVTVSCSLSIHYRLLPIMCVKSFYVMYADLQGGTKNKHYQITKNHIKSY